MTKKKKVMLKIKEQLNIPIIETKSYGSKFCETIEEGLMFLNDNKLKYVDIVDINQYGLMLIFERCEYE